MVSSSCFDCGSPALVLIVCPPCAEARAAGSGTWLAQLVDEVQVQEPDRDLNGDRTTPAPVHPERELADQTRRRLDEAARQRWIRER